MLADLAAHRHRGSRKHPTKSAGPERGGERVDDDKWPMTRVKDACASSILGHSTKGKGEGPPD